MRKTGGGRCQHSRKAGKWHTGDGVFGIKGWAKIKANGKEGYVSTKYLSATKPGTLTKTAVTIKTATKYVNVSTGSLNMRKSGVIVPA
ncbi:hypothetical protein KEH51_02005 [[Brevibacterium] frigoritolerans]|uniref:SH3b domain-containing protein n=1 Tax=Peribacillus frigoritolerans TaxID=450367 RepID=A0A941J4H4_9BACI|nr:hypothetical protein [Peribacillus frigoritolerans]